MNESKTPFVILIVSLAVVGSWGVFKIIKSSTTVDLLSAENDGATIQSDTPFQKDPIYTSAKEPESNPLSQPPTYNKEMAAIAALIEQGKYQAVMSQVNELYSQLNSPQLEQIKEMVLSEANQLINASKSKQAIELLTKYTDSYDDSDALYLLAKAARMTKQWKLALDAMMKYNTQEYRPEKIESMLSEMVFVANQIRASLELQRDQIGIRNMYHRLYEQHPNYPRFQLELAQSYLRLNQAESALPLLENLKFDDEYGAIAKQNLNKIEQQLASEIEKPNNPESVSYAEVVVPLIKSGNSFFAKTKINSRTATLLLDTGASITALSKDTIRRLKLAPSGQQIRLNTANGVTNSRLYVVNNITLGSFKVNNLLVAEIEMTGSEPFQGLLGTDLLNKLDPRYNYLIDNQRNALILRRK